MPNYLSPGVYVEEVEAGSRPIEGVGTAVAAFVGLAAQGPFNAPTLVTNWSQFTPAFGDFVEGSYLAHAVYGYFNNGGGACYVVRIGQDGAAPNARAELTSATDKTLSAYRVTALEAGPSGNAIQVEVTRRRRGRRRLVHAHDQEQRRRRRSTRRSRPRRASRTSSRSSTTQSKLIQIEEIGNAGALERKPAAGKLTLSGGESSGPTSVSPQDYVGDSADRTGLRRPRGDRPRHDARCPDLMSAYQKGLLDLEGVKAVQLAMIAHCELMGDRVAILDPPPGLNAAADPRVARREGRLRLQVRDALLAVDQGVRPRERQERVRAAERPHGRHLGPQRRHARRAQGARERGRPRRASTSRSTSRRREHDLLNPDGINCIRSFPGRGIRVWGARTSRATRPGGTSTSAGSSTTSRSRSSNGTQWVVFEPNDLDLWQRIRRTINAFLLGVWRDGALFGATPERGVLRQVRRGDQPARRRRRRPGHLRDRDRAGQAGRVRRLPPRPVLGRRGSSPSKRKGGTWDYRVRKTHSLAIHFSIEIDGVTIAQFKEVSGLNAEIQTIEHRENKLGGLPVLKKLPGARKWGDLTLKRGRTDNKALWDWIKTVQDGKIDGRAQERLDRAVRLRRTARCRASTSSTAWPSKVTHRLAERRRQRHPRRGSAPSCTKGSRLHEQGA